MRVYRLTIEVETVGRHRFLLDFKVAAPDPDAACERWQERVRNPMWTARRLLSVETVDRILP